MNFNVTPLSESSAVVHVGDVLDFRNAEAFKETCEKHVDDGARNLIIDFSGTDILDSTGLGAIFSLHRSISPDNGQIAFASISKAVRKVIKLTRTYEVFDAYSSVEAAQEAMD